MKDPLHHYALEKFYAKLAKNALVKMSLNQNVHLEVITTDVYGREVVKAQSPSGDVALKLLSQGLAMMAYFSLEKNDKFYYPDSKYYFLLKKAQEEAKENNRGFWKYPQSRTKEIFPKHFR